MESGDMVSGYIGFGFDFDGCNDWIDLDEGPLDAGFFHDLDTYQTVEMWIKADDTSSDQTLFEEVGSTNGLLVGINADNVRFATRNSGSQVTVNTASYHYSAEVFDNGTLISYLDASPQRQATAR